MNTFCICFWKKMFENKFNVCVKKNDAMFPHKTIINDYIYFQPEKWQQYTS